MALNKLKIKKKSLIQISLLFFGLLIIFFTYFYDRNKEPLLDQTIKKEVPKDVVEKEGFNTFENIAYEGKDGTMVLFPSQVLHHVEPQHQNKERITLAFNIVRNDAS